MNSNITFSQFERVLSDLGFHQRTAPNIGIVYEHPPTDTLIVVRFHHKPDEIVPWHVLAPARRHLDTNRVIDAADFEELLRKAAA